MNPPFASVIVVNFNGRHLLAECLESVSAQDYPRERFEVIVVDNASTDGSVEMVRKQFPSVKLVLSGKNLGSEDRRSRVAHCLQERAGPDQ
jgi:GT2 family glycosyltransferase